MTYYRTYRPQSINEIDNLKVRALLSGLLKKKISDFPHAFFLYGPRGAGKTTAARVIAKLFNCENPGSAGSCGVCNQCVSIAEGKNIDVLEIDAASNRGIDEIRALRDSIALSPAHSTYRVYIIDEVHMLTTEAFNALLKTLEEPPSHAVFILATTDQQKVPVTIQSRTTPIVFSRATSDEILVALKRIAKKEKLSVDDDALELLAGRVDGSFRDAVKFLEQLSFTDGVITKKAVADLLLITGADEISQFIAHVLGRRLKEAVAAVETMHAHGKDMKTVLSDCAVFLNDMLLRTISDGNHTSAEIRDISALMDLFNKAYADMKNSVLLQVPIELAVVRFCTQSDSAVVNTSVAATEKPVASKSTENQEAKKSTQSKPAMQPPTENKVQTADQTNQKLKQNNQDTGSGPMTLTIEKLSNHWPDYITALKAHNHSVAGVLRSTRPKTVRDGIVTIEAFFPFHKDKLSESKSKDMLIEAIHKLFGEKVKVEIVLGKK